MVGEPDPRDSQGMQIKRAVISSRANPNHSSQTGGLEVTAGLLLLPAFELPRGLDSECPVTEFVLLRQLSLREHGRLDA